MKREPLTEYYINYGGHCRGHTSEMLFVLQKQRTLHVHILEAASEDTAGNIKNIEYIALLSSKIAPHMFTNKRDF